jgi:nucleotide-binding universal stress UspA family protein
MQQKNKRILVAIDGSDQSLNAVRYLSKLPFSSKPKVVLFHVIRRIDQAFWDIGVSPMSRGQMVEISGWDLERKKKAQEFMNLAFEILDADYEKELVKEINEEMEITFTTAKEHLVNAGLDAQELSTKFNAGVSNRASAIIGEARLGAYGTIVMGRRGL